MIPQIDISNGRPRTFNVLNTLTKFHAFADETNGKYCLIEAVVPVGAGAPPHSHPGETEAFFVLEGQVKFLMGAIGPKEVIAKAGDFVAIPDGAIHSFVAIGDTPARLLVINAPGHAHAAFFTAVGEVMPDDANEPLPPIAPNGAFVAQEAARAGITLVG
ncbi:MAG: cupin domain-containing protein [Pseudomonadota bacterium]